MLWKYLNKLLLLLCHVTFDVNKPPKFGHSSQPRTIHVGTSESLFQVQVTI